MEPEDMCRIKATSFFADVEIIRAYASDFVRSEGWDDYVLLKMTCSLGKDHPGDHVAYYMHDLDQEELLSWPQIRSPLDPFQGV